MRVTFYYALLTITFVYAHRCGGRDAQRAAWIMVVGSIATHLAWSKAANRLLVVEYGVAIVDVATLAAFTIVTCLSRANWLLWLTALQLTGLAGHAARVIVPDMLGTSYLLLLSVWSYPMLALIGLGAMAERQRTLRGLPAS